MNSKCDTSVLPNNIFSLQGDEFFQCIEQLAGGMLYAILKIQLIDSTQAFMNSTDLFDIFQYNSPEINCLRDKVYFQTENGDYILKSGITTNLSLLRNLLNAKKEEQQNSHYNQQQEQISINLINNNPLLKSLFRWYEQNEKVENKEQTFLKTFIDTITNNLTKSPNNYRYSESVEQFALSLYILGGKMTYQFVRMNLSPALPSVQTLDKLISNDDSKINEAQFRFDKLQEYFDRINVKYAFGSEDCTGVIRRINYDQQTNSFIGFASPLINGIPVAKHYQTNSFDQLKSWFSSSDKSPLLNIHMIQPLQPENHLTGPAAFLLSGYGVVNTYTSMDILRRWLFIFNNCLQKNIRIIGFSTDGDAKYMRAMRLVNGFFASLPHFKLNEHQEAFDLTTAAKWSWFYLRKKQLLLFFQDGIHIVTKWRNRLLSSTAQLRLGRQYISIEHLIDIIEDTNYSKLDHGLTRSDLNPKDRQNYNSCVKIASDDILSILVDGTDTYGTFIYLQLLKMIILTYVKKTTRINERLQSAWCIVFVCRLWWTWIQHKQFTSTTASTTTKRNSKEKFFITKTAYLSVELNAHNLLYMILLVKQRQLPKEALNVYLFNSQHCESMFRNARSLSGTYSTIVNFTVADFLRRSQKISVLNRIKCEQLSQQDDNERLSFPFHHKHNHDNDPSSLQNLDDIDQLDIEKIISDAFNQALQLTERLEISKLLKEHDVFELNSLSDYVFQKLNSSSKMFDYSTQTIDDDSNEFNLEEEDEEDDTNDIINNLNGDEEINDDIVIDQEEDDDYSMTTIRANFNGIKISDGIEHYRRDAYFKVKINDNQKYIHKQSACWLLTDQNMRLSNDRLSRVIQTSRKDNNSLF